MIRLTDIDGYSIYMAPGQISSVTRLTSLHTQAMVYLANGIKHEVREHPEQVAKLVKEHG
jgi:uncharacterized protein YlzI (FlbEa/FlbD family)